MLRCKHTHTLSAVVHTPAVSFLTALHFFSLLSVLFSCLQWRNVWAPCRWEPRWWSSVAAPRDWCGSSIWTNTSRVSAGGPRARMKRPRVSTLPPLVLSWEQHFQLCVQNSDLGKTICAIFLCDRQGLVTRHPISPFSLWISNVILSRGSVELYLWHLHLSLTEWPLHLLLIRLLHFTGQVISYFYKQEHWK